MFETFNKILREDGWAGLYGGKDRCILLSNQC